MKIFCYIPSACLQPGEVSSQVRRSLTLAMEAGIAPVAVPSGLTSQAIDLDDAQVAHVTKLGKSLGLAPGRVVGALLYAMHLNGGAIKGADGSRETQIKVGPILIGLRPGQIACLQEVAPLLVSSKVTISELGTGSGKGRLIAHAAEYALRLLQQGELGAPPVVVVPKSKETEGDIPESKPKGGVRSRAVVVKESDSDGDNTPRWILEHAAKAQEVHKARLAVLGFESPKAVVVCAPSIDNVVHLAREWDAVRAVLDPKHRILSAILLGKGQFVSGSELKAMLDDCETEQPEIEKWLSEGMPAGLCESTRSLKKLEPEIRGLMADLEFLADKTTFACAEASLDEDSPIPDGETYRLLKERASSAHLVWTTTAMLCLDTLQLADPDSKPLIPPAAALFIDEGHTLETWQSNVAGHSLSFAKLGTELGKDETWMELRKSSNAKNALATLRKLREAMADIPNETKLPMMREQVDQRTWDAWSKAKTLIEEFKGDLTSLTKGLDAESKKEKRAKHIRTYRYAVKALRALKYMDAGCSGHIGHTPVRGHITLNVGPNTVSKYLAARWAVTPTAMLLSGTMCHIGASGPNHAPMMRELAIPAGRVAMTLPVHPSWLHNAPTLLIPKNDQYHRLIPPTGEAATELSLAVWLGEVARAIKVAAADAQGGMLVLMSGYDRLEGLEIALRAMRSDTKTRLLVQTRHTKVSACASEFKRRAKAGERPIWLATGAAWTGLDLADEKVDDEQAALDNILTDLVIPNVPFGVQRSNSHIARVSFVGLGAELIVAQRLFRQGLGRLMRRSGLRNRRIWVLDGRLFHPPAYNYTADFRRVLVGYIRKEEFKF